MGETYDDQGLGSDHDDHEAGLASGAQAAHEAGLGSAQAHEAGLTSEVHPAGLTSDCHELGLTSDAHEAGFTSDPHDAGLASKAHGVGLISATGLASPAQAEYWSGAEATFTGATCGATWGAAAKF